MQEMMEVQMFMCIYVVNHDSLSKPLLYSEKGIGISGKNANSRAGMLERHLLDFLLNY